MLEYLISCFRVQSSDLFLNKKFHLFLMTSFGILVINKELSKTYIVILIYKISLSDKKNKNFVFMSTAKVMYN